MSLQTDHTDPAAAGPAATREALLRAAGQVFADVGFRTATVREICQRAGVNVAAVNYHFRDKETLYLEVLRFALSTANARYPFAREAEAGAPPERRLRSFVGNLLALIFDSGEHAWLGRLMAKEMIEPSHALDFMIAERIQPMASQLRRLVREIVGNACADEAVRLCGFSIVSQCLFYNHCRSVVTRLFPEHQLTPDAVQSLADHITEFSLAGLRHFARTDERAQPAPTPPKPAPQNAFKKSRSHRAERLTHLHV